MNERRGAPRYEVVLKVRYETEKEFQNAVIHNLSAGGVYLATATPFEAGSEFYLEIALPNAEEWLRGQCRVVWVNEIETEQFPKGMGVAFLEMPPKYKELFDQAKANSEGR